MSRFMFFSFFALIVINISCERCRQCRYSHTETIIVQTPEGEVEEKIEKTDIILLDEDGEPYGSECLKYKDYKEFDDPKDAFSIDNFYELESQQTNLENFEYTCEER